MSKLSKQPDLLQQIEFYRLLVNSVQDYAIFMLDTDGRVATWNLGAQKLKGYQASDIIGQHFSVFFTPEDVAAGKPAAELEACLAAGHFEIENWRVKQDGSYFWASVVVTALYDEAGDLVGYAKVTRDLSDRKRSDDAMQHANEQLRYQQAELQQLNEAKDEFIALASHQLRTPATGVKQYLGMLIDGYSGQMTDGQLEIARRAYLANDRQISLVNDLLMVAQVDAGRVQLIKESLKITSFVRSVAEDMRPSLEAKNQQLILNIPDSSITCQIDELRFRMVLENLIDNASKYTESDGKIEIGVKVSSSVVTIYIKDNGIGIPSDSISKLFSKFARIPNQLSEAAAGSGLGLYWAEKIVGLHDSQIEVDSKLGEGSTFSIRLNKERAS